MFENYIVKGIGGFYYVKTANGIIECKAKGIFRKRKITPVAGDFVQILQENGTNVIAEIMPRKNVFVRPPIANVDNFFIVCSTIQPAPSTLVIDKLSAIAVNKGAQPILIITKTDLASTQFLMESYRLSKIPCICIDVDNYTQAVEIISKLLKNKISVFCGNSGVGKSTLLSQILPNEQLETAEISQKLGRGKHTTREVTLFEVCGGLVADTPGFSSLDMQRACFIEKTELQYAFTDIAEFAHNCKFIDCSHTVEKGCAVRQALEDNQLSQSRYHSYVEMYHEAKEVKEWQKP